jgi:hypothetical protein
MKKTIIITICAFTLLPLLFCERLAEDVAPVKIPTVDTVDALDNDNKKVVIFSTKGMVSHELSHSNAYVYDVKNIKNFVCWNKERVL